MEIFEITLQNRQTEIGFNTSLNFITTIHWILLLLLLLLLYAIPDVLLRTSADYDTAINIILHEGAGSMYYDEE